MGTGKIEFSFGGFDFKGEGDEQWVSKQLLLVLDKVPELLKHVPAASKPGFNGGDKTPQENPGVVGTLAKFLNDHTATKSQNKKFLATAAWLTLKGSSRLTTADVTGALRNHHQTKINNPSETLNQNASKGYCQKESKQFFVTPEGFEYLGIER
ncbi:hypothetical protein Pan44_25110 [Caulifigura coniformis]|uniref:Uncharacterized protein n=1 Tax=Caulifigura coniformis TaxID=2527983 RepID=A0A517SEE4_9PLAN|nr:hypothetical protein [Caulifigura coniformis]QDT54478.1 hypothetical protein Pan44_25110 [Caulifigura coniformis]